MKIKLQIDEQVTKLVAEDQASLNEFQQAVVDFITFDIEAWISFKELKLPSKEEPFFKNLNREFQTPTLLPLFHKTESNIIVKDPGFWPQNPCCPCQCRCQSSGMIYYMASADLPDQI